MKTLETLQREAHPATLLAGLDMQLDSWPEAMDLLAVWRGKAGDQCAPRRCDFSITDLTAFLPLMSVHDVSYDPFSIKTRLTGTAVVDATGVDSTGQDLVGWRGTDALMDRAGWIIRTCQPLICLDIPMTWSPRDYKTFDIMGLPILSEDGDVVQLFYYGRYLSAA